jgi:hypothetical protein
MKKAGDLLSLLFDERLLKTAKGYSALFSSWASIIGEKIAAHSRIRELKHSIVFVEADHPGWIQILQTKQQGILKTLQCRFPDLNILGISFRLSKEPLYIKPEADTIQVSEVTAVEGVGPEPETTDEPATDGSTERVADPYERINNDEFKVSLKRLEKSISLRTNRKKQ